MNNWGIKTDLSEYEGPNFWTEEILKLKIVDQVMQGLQFIDKEKAGSTIHNKDGFKVQDPQSS